MGEEDKERLSEAERRALRGSKFAPLPSLPPPSSRSHHHRFAHPGGPLATNKAAALAKFLERKLHEPGGLSSVDPDLVELAVKNAKDTIKASTSGNSNSGRTIRHVDSFGDSDEDTSEDKGNQKKDEETKLEKLKVKKKKRLASSFENRSSEDEENQKKARETKFKKLKKKKSKKKKCEDTARPSKRKRKFKS